MENNIEQKIKGDNNDQSINKIENSNNTITNNNMLYSMENVKSQNIQNQVNVYTGCQITENQVREISANIAKQVVQENFLLAHDLAEKRMENFQEKMIQKLTTLETKFECFKDPSFNWFYRQAQIKAALTDDNNTYNMLCELLIDREEKGDDKINQTSIAGAIEIVEQLSDSTLSALTILTCLSIGIKPKSSKINEGLDILEELFSSILINELPNDFLWIEQLDILKAIRIKDYSSLKKFEDLISEMYDGYVCVGIEEGSDNYYKAKDIENKLGYSLLVKNELLDKYYKLPIISQSDIGSLYKNINGSFVHLSDYEQEQYKEIYNLYSNDSELMKKVKNKFIDLMDSRKHLKLIHEWWNNIKYSFAITSIGRVLGHANAQNRYKGFPPLN